MIVHAVATNDVICGVAMGNNLITLFCGIIILLITVEM